ncbi:MAG TPA: peptidylprolyl isomerase, partial [Algoriphagus sp.]|nr:peptidylprolyl isomerase [Algoriphagus sp.]
KIYQEMGGTPHLDQNYTVFGQTISGMEVIDAIATVATDSRDRPKENVYILKMTWLNPPNP